MPYEISHSGKLEDRRENPDELTDSCIYSYIVQTEDDLELTEDESDELRENLHKRCYCEHDCCGHYFGGVSSITKIWPGRYVVLASYARNY